MDNFTISPEVIISVGALEWADDLVAGGSLTIKEDTVAPPAPIWSPGLSDISRLDTAYPHTVDLSLLSQNATVWAKIAGTGTGTISGSVLTLPADEYPDDYTYTIRASNSGAETADDSMTVTVTGTAPVIDSQPSNDAVTEGDQATFSASASHDHTSVYYLWQINDGVWKPVTDVFPAATGETSSLLTIPTEIGDVGSHTIRCRFRSYENVLGSWESTSNTVSLTIDAIAAPVWTNPTPTASYVDRTTPKTFDIDTVCNDATDYALNTGSGSITGSILTIADNQYPDDYGYSITASNTGNLTSDGTLTATITGTAPTIDTQPTHASPITEGDTITLTAAASHPNTSDIYYRWEVDGALPSTVFSDVTGETTGTLVINTIVSEAASYNFVCKCRSYVNDATWEVDTNTVAITVDALVMRNEYTHDFSTQTLGAFTHARGSIATALTAAETVTTYSANAAAWYLDYGLQIEGAMTNLIVCDEPTDFNYWNLPGQPDFHTNPREHPTKDAPDGNTSYIFDRNINAQQGFHDIVIDPTGMDTQSKSVWARAEDGEAGKTCVLNYYEEVQGQVDIGYTWERYRSGKGINYPQATYAAEFRGDGSYQTANYLISALYQVIEGPLMGSYIPNATKGAATQRKPDFVNSTTAGMSINPITDECSLQVIFYTYEDLANLHEDGVVLRLQDAGANDTLTIRRGGTNSFVAELTGSVAASVTILDSAWTFNDVVDLRVRKGPAGLAMWVGQNLATASTAAGSGAFTNPLTETKLGSEGGTGGVESIGHMIAHSVRYVDVADDDGTIIGWDTWAP